MFKIFYFFTRMSAIYLRMKKSFLNSPDKTHISASRRPIEPQMNLRISY